MNRWDNSWRIHCQSSWRQWTRNFWRFAGRIFKGFVWRVFKNISGTIPRMNSYGFVKYSYGRICGTWRIRWLNFQKIGRTIFFALLTATKTSWRNFWNFRRFLEGPPRGVSGGFLEGSLEKFLIAKRNHKKIPVKNHKWNLVLKITGRNVGASEGISKVFPGRILKWFIVRISLKKILKIFWKKLFKNILTEFLKYFLGNILKVPAQKSLEGLQRSSWEIILKPTAHWKKSLRGFPK